MTVSIQHAQQKMPFVHMKQLALRLEMLTKLHKVKLLRPSVKNVLMLSPINLQQTISHNNIVEFVGILLQKNQDWTLSLSTKYSNVICLVQIYIGLIFQT